MLELHASPYSYSSLDKQISSAAENLSQLGKKSIYHMHSVSSVSGRFTKKKFLL